MTVSELRKDKEYKLCFEKIKSYPKGFIFTLEWTKIPKPQANALKIVMQDATERGLLDVTEFLLALDGTETGRVYQKL